MGLVARENGRGSGCLAQGPSCLALGQAKPLMERSRLEIMW
ncbi:mCG1032919 [Mus musculus]|nr:mCG1032919 [Mus musculus]